MKLVCVAIDDKCMDDGTRHDAPEIGEIVTVVYTYSCGYYRLKGYDNGYVFNPKCFKPIHYQFAEEALMAIKEMELV